MQITDSCCARSQMQRDGNQARSQDFCRGGHDDGGTKGPERGAEARSAGAPRGVGSG